MPKRNQKIAEYIEEGYDSTWAHHVLYSINPPVRRGGQTFCHVVVATCKRRFATDIYPADENGRILDWQGLPGSVRGTLDHDDALCNAGYKPMYPQVRVWTNLGRR